YTNFMIIYMKSGLDGSVGLPLNLGLLQFGAKLESSAAWFFANTPVRSNVVMHLVGVYDQGQTVCLYVDGNLASSVAIPEDTLFVDLSFPLVSALGIYDYTPSPYAAFRGVIDDVRIYARAFSGVEVAQLHAAEAQCFPHAATAVATISGGSVAAISVLEPGCGYTNPPSVGIIGGGGSGAGAVAALNGGYVSSITVTNGGSGYTNTPLVLISSPPFMPSLSIGVSKVKVTMHLLIGHNYVLQSSPDLHTWTQVEGPFMATTEFITQEFDVQMTGQYFRVQEVP
ncbi:MAG: LamG-like jellyroll fold domain-containing protein, partial [Limisphaerales bacterium]